MYTPFHTYILVLFVIVCSIVSIYYNKRLLLIQRSKRLDYESEAQTLRTKLASMENLCESQRKIYNEICDKNRTRIDEVILLYNLGGDEKTKTRASNKFFKQYVESIRDLKEIEYFVDNAESNILSKFKQDFPRCSRAQYNLIILVFAGFSYPTMSFILDIPVENLYVKRWRLKNMISRSTAPYKQEYLRYF